MREGAGRVVESCEEGARTLSGGARSGDKAGALVRVPGSNPKIEPGALPDVLVTVLAASAVYGFIYFII